MRCPKCEFENPAGMNFREKCRTALGLICPSLLVRKFLGIFVASALRRCMAPQELTGS
jgi:hypothetical protein